MNRWERRIARAAELEKRYPSAAEVLRFYREIATFQSDSRIGPDARRHLPALLELVRRTGTAVLADRAAFLLAEPRRLDEALAERQDPFIDFFLRAIEQPYFERQAAQARVDTSTVQPNCPFCLERPLVAILRPEGEGGRRTLLCGRCFTEWQFRRLLCPSCGEEDRDKLPVYTAAELPHIRVEACDSCRQYLKAVDLTLDGTAIPEVDALAALPLDLWAADRGYEASGTGLLAGLL